MAHIHSFVHIFFVLFLFRVFCGLCIWRWWWSASTQRNPIIAQLFGWLRRLLFSSRKTFKWSNDSLQKYIYSENTETHKTNWREYLFDSVSVFDIGGRVLLLPLHSDASVDKSEWMETTKWIYEKWNNGIYGAAGSWAVPFLVFRWVRNSVARKKCARLIFICLIYFFSFVEGCFYSWLCRRSQRLSEVIYGVVCYYYYLAGIRRGKKWRDVTCIKSVSTRSKGKNNSFEMAKGKKIVKNLRRILYENISIRSCMLHHHFPGIPISFVALIARLPSWQQHSLQNWKEQKNRIERKWGRSRETN